MLPSSELIHSFSRAAADAQMAIWGYPSPPHPLPPSPEEVARYLRAVTLD
jgi:hypothetical protein